MHETFPTYKKILLQDMASINSSILTAFQTMSPKDYDKQTHYFHGRYENIYINEERIPQLELLISKIKNEVSKYLNADNKQIKMGFWLNVMMPGQVTSRHCHDDLDEMVSGVYYIKVPDQSGKLILHSDKDIEIEPQESMLILFSPALDHQVLVNNSQDIRLSIGLNACLISDN